jgi:hypothetical protein
MWCGPAYCQQNAREKTVKRWINYSISYCRAEVSIERYNSPLANHSCQLSYLPSSFALVRDIMKAAAAVNLSSTELTLSNQPAVLPNSISYQPILLMTTLPSLDG